MQGMNRCNKRHQLAGPELCLSVFSADMQTSLDRMGDWWYHNPKMHEQTEGDGKSVPPVLLGSVNYAKLQIKHFPKEMRLII